jgi:hypothetical protein
MWLKVSAEDKVPYQLQADELNAELALLREGDARDFAAAQQDSQAAAASSFVTAAAAAPPKKRSKLKHEPTVETGGTAAPTPSGKGKGQAKQPAVKRKPSVSPSTPRAAKISKSYTPTEQEVKEKMLKLYEESRRSESGPFASN